MKPPAVSVPVLMLNILRIIPYQDEFLVPTHVRHICKAFAGSTVLSLVPYRFRGHK